MKKNIVLFSALFSLMASVSFAADKIYTMGYNTCIMADDLEWSCGIHNSDTAPGLSKSSLRPHISGNSKHFPVSFVFFVPWKVTNSTNKIENAVKTVLRDYAIETSTVLSNVTTKEASTLVPYRTIVEADYFNNASAGHLQYRIELIDGMWFAMLSKINSVLLDDHSRTILYESAFALVTPLYNPKALTLWLEEVERNEETVELE